MSFMRFQRMTDAYRNMIDHIITNTNKINDFSAGSAIGAILRAIAIQREEFSMLTRENIEEGIQEGVFEAFDFSPKDAQRAYGIQRIYFNNPTQANMTLSRGSTFTSSLSEYSQVFETTREYTIPAGTTNAEVEIRCTMAGEIGNVPQGTIDTMRSPLQNVRKVENPQAFSTGQDKEPIEEVKARFNAFIESRGRGTNKAVEYGARTVNEISGVYIQENIGQIIVYAHDRNGDLSSSLQGDVVTALEDYRPAGIDLRVEPVNKTNLNVNVEITLSDRALNTPAFRSRIRTVIENSLNSSQVSQHLILSNLSRQIMNIDRRVIYDVKTTNPSANVEVLKSEIIRAGTINLTMKSR